MPPLKSYALVASFLTKENLTEVEEVAAKRKAELLRKTGLGRVAKENSLAAHFYSESL
jgi:hypothetical protein